MLADYVQPSSYTLMALVRASTSLKDVELGRWIHTEITCKGFGKEPFLGNILFHVYNKCGSPADARNVFDKLPVRDVVAWSALIGAFAENGLAKEALECFEGMQLEDVSPNAVTFVSSLKTCGNLAAINKGREIHSQLVQNGFETNTLIGNSLLDMSVKCGSFLEAQDVFDMLPVCDLVSWNTLIAGYAENGFGLEALRYYEEMQIEGMRPDAITFVSSLKSCGCLVAIEKGREIQAFILKKGFDRDLFVGNALIGMYAKCGSLYEAQKVFDNLPVQDVVSWNALILGYAENGLNQEVVKFLDQMVLQNVVPNTVTFVSILKACESLGDVDRGREVHLKIADRGLENDVVVGSALVDMYSKCCSLAESQSVFENLLIRDDRSWSALIACYAEHGFPEEALKCFGEMILNGVSLTAVAYVSALKACGIMAAIGKGRQIHTDIVQRGLENDLFVGSALVHMYAKCGVVTEAHKVFDMLPFRDVVSWTTLIAGYVENGLPEEALRYFDQMHGEGVTPDAFIFVCSLKACSNMFAIDKGKEIHHEIVQKGFQEDLFVGSSLVDMYSKFGCLSEAKKVLVLDGKLQSAEADEFVYHEILVHPALLHHTSPQSVFIMGGGEGSTAREALKHKSVKKVVMCDIDKEVVDFCRAHLSDNREAFQSPRLELVIYDARIELEKRKEKFDVIIGELADPVEGGPCYKLYTELFYEKVVKPRLNLGGILVTQAGPAGILSHREV